MTEKSKKFIPGEIEPLQTIHDNLDEAKDHLSVAIDQALRKGECLEDLEKRTESLQKSAHMFHRHTQENKWITCWQHYRCLGMATCLGIGSLYVVVSSACGDWSLQTCD